MKKMKAWMIALLGGFLVSQSSAATHEEAFASAMSGDWEVVFSDSGTNDWTDNWFLDGEVGTVSNSVDGMTLTAGPEALNNAHHMVLWTKESFEGDVKIEYDYTRLDDASKYVNILYIQATGSGEGAYATDISEWTELRTVPAMSTYYDNMNLYHISYATATNDNYIRGRRYMPNSNGLDGTELDPDYENLNGFFEKGVPHHITVVKKDREIFMKVENAEKTGYFHMSNLHLPSITEGRIGLRHMFTRSSIYKNFSISTNNESVDAEAVIAGFDARVDKMFRDESGNPLVREEILPPLGNGRPPFSRYYSYSMVAYAARCLYLGEDLEAANAALAENAQFYIDNPDAVSDRDNFHWHACEVMRLLEMYGPNGTDTAGAGRLTQATVDLCLQPIFAYAQVESMHWEYEDSKTWNLYGSENHHAMSVATSWQFAKIAKDHPDYAAVKYAGDLTPAEHYAEWSEYFIRYCRERAKKGMFVEMMSGKYNTSFIKGIYNFYDFGEGEVKQSARQFLDLFFAYFAQEQLDGIQGGGKSRIYFIQGLPSERVEGIKQLVWYYFGIGEQPVVNSHESSAALSDYRPPAIVADLVLDPKGRGSYEVKQFPRGLVTSGGTNPNRINPNYGGIQRYTYCEPSFMMGTPMVEARPQSDWAAISCQNRTQSVIFPGETPSRIVVVPKPKDNRKVLNGFWSVQRKGCLISQKLSGDYNDATKAEEMIVWMSQDGLSEPVDEEGIVFVEAPEAYVAVRVGPSGYTLAEETLSAVNSLGNTETAPPAWVISANAEYEPVILEVMAKTRVASFDKFKQRVKARTPEYDGTVLSYTSIYGDTLTLDTAYALNPTVNGKAVDYTPPEKVFESPFLNSDYDSGVVTLSKGTRELVLDFSEPVTLSSLTPENTAPDVALNALFTATFDGDIVAGSGAISLKKSDGTLVETFDVNDAAEVTISGSQLSFTPSSYLEMDTSYYIEIPEGVVGNFFDDFSGNSYWSFTTIDTYPAVTEFLPSDGVTNAPLNTPLMATFDVPVEAGTGNVLLKTGGTTVESFDVMDSDAVTFSGNSVIFPPSVELVADTVYTIEIPANAVRGQNGVFHQGDSWSFSVTDSKALVVVNRASYVTSDKVGSKSYNFAANGDMIVVAFSSYASKKLAPVISYGGNPLTKAVLGGFDGDSFAGIWYLDLTTTDYVAGNAELKVEIAENQPTGVGIGVVSLSAGGAGIELDATQVGANTEKPKSIKLTPSQDGAFSMVSFYGYGDDTDPTIKAPLTTIYATHEMNNRSAGAGYQLNVPAEEQTYSWTVKYGRGIAAASFILSDQTLYALTVVDGSDNTGDGSYTKGSEVSIAADSAPAGYYFSGWTSNNGGTFADATAASTTFTMPLGATTVTANYAEIVAPEITTRVPGVDATEVPANTSLTATFDMPVQVGSGFIALKKSSGGSTVELFDVTDSNAVNFSGATISFTPSNKLESGVTYTIEIPAGAVQSQYGATNEALSWSFTVTDIQSIVKVNTASHVVASSLDNSSTSFGFDASADMIIVAVSTERGSGDVAVRYDGHTLINAVDNLQAGIWYLDLTQTDYAGGFATLEIDFTNVGIVNGVGVGVVSVSAGGAGIGLHATAAAGTKDAGESSVNLTTTQEGTFSVVSFNANGSGNTSVNAPLTEIYTSNDIGSAHGAAGYQANVPAGTHTYSWTTSSSNKRAVAAASFVIRENSFSSWVDQNNLGEHSGLGDDPDGDGVPNGIEAVFGSNPSEASAGLVALNVSGEQISFSHPQVDPLPSDLQLSYSWSIDLINWYDCDGVAGPASGETVSVSSELLDGTSTVTVTPSAELDCLYLRAKVQEK